LICFNQNQKFLKKKIKRFLRKFPAFLKFKNEKRKKVEEIKNKLQRIKNEQKDWI
jgi:hypothetical protein